MKKSVILTPFIILAAVLFAACSNGKTESTPSSGETASAVYTESQTDGMVSKKLSSGVVVNAKVLIPDNVDFSQLRSYSSSLKKLDISAAKDTLLATESNVTKSEFVTEEDPFKEFVYTMYQTENGDLLAGQGNILNYCSSNQPNVESYLFLEHSHEYNADKFLTDREFTFGSKQSCFEEIKNVLANLGIEVTDSYICYSVDHTTLTEAALQTRADILEKAREFDPQTAEDELLEYPNPNYTEDDDCYYFKIFATAGGLPITHSENGIFANGGFTPGSIINAIYSKDGIVKLYCSNIYEITGVTSTKEGMNLDAAIQMLDDKYNSIIIDGEYQVQEIAFEYVPVSDGGGLAAELVPAWRFQIKHTVAVSGKGTEETSSVDLYDYVLLNAVTGKEILKDVGGI